MHDRIIRFDDQTYAARSDHGGTGLVRSARARSGPGPVCCNFIDCVVVPPGATIGLHSHTMDNEELYVIIQGTGVMTLEDMRAEIGPGDTIINPPGGTHGLENTGNIDLRLVVVEYPATVAGRCV